MKTLLNILIAISIFLIMWDCEANAMSAEMNYQNAFLGLFGVVVFGFFRVYHKEFKDFLTKEQ